MKLDEVTRPPVKVPALPLSKRVKAADRIRELQWLASAAEGTQAEYNKFVETFCEAWGVGQIYQTKEWILGLARMYTKAKEVQVVVVRKGASHEEETKAGNDYVQKYLRAGLKVWGRFDDASDPRFDNLVMWKPLRPGAA